MRLAYFRGVSVFFADRDWPTKLIVATLALISGLFIPLLGQILVLGWIALVTRRAARTDEGPLPRLDFDIDHLLKVLEPGAKAGLALLVWTVPAIAVGLALLGCVYTAITLGLAGSVALTVALQQPAALGLGALAWVCGVWATFPIYLVVVALAALPASIAMLRVELTDQLEEGFRFGEVMQMTRLLLWELVAIAIVYTVVGWITATVSMLLLGLPLFPLAVITSVSRAWVFGALYRRYLEKGGEPLALVDETHLA